MSAVSDEEKAYILTHHYDGRDDVAKTKSSSSATSSVPWYRQAAFVGCAALLAGVVIGRGLSPDARSGSQIGGQGTTPCFCGGNETNALPAHLAAEERMEEVISEKPEVEHEQHKSAAREKFREQLREEYREERRERHGHREHAPMSPKRENGAERTNEKAEKGSKNEQIDKGRRHLPNIVSGLMDVEMSPYETANSLGNAKEPGICRDFAKDSKEKYIAWAWTGANAPDAKLRETCLFYRQIKPFHGRPGDHNHVTGCTDFVGSPFTGCTKEDNDDSKTHGQSGTGAQLKRSEDSRKNDDDSNNNRHQKSQNVDKSKPNAVHGLLAANIDFEIPLGMGESKRARDCREYAENHHTEFVAFAHISSRSKNQALRSTCLFYKQIVPFDGIPEESVVITACTDPGLSPVTACKGKATTSFKHEDVQALTPADRANGERETSSKEKTLPLTSLNVVRGLIGMDQVDFETPLGTGSARDPSFCRDYASDETHPYRAWAWISNESEDEEMRQTCLFYSTFKAFPGSDDDKVHITGCADKSHSPAFACER